MYQVYIVDDDPVILDEIVQTVPWLDNGFSVAGYHTAPEAAIEEIATLRPQVVFSDLKMPTMDGIDMIRALVNRGCTCEFVMLSAYGTFEDSRRFFLLNGFDYLLKPFQQGEVQLVLERLAKRLSLATPQQESLETAPYHQVFQELLSYLEHHLGKKHSLEELGQRFHLSPNYICSLFAKHLGSTLTRHITALRMDEALRRMRGSRTAFKEIAIDCGYPDYYYFCKVFKEYYGASPSVYLRQLGEER